ncbi:MAG: hypothetical protein ABI670_10680 [Chloroflexota bacterium]
MSNTEAEHIATPVITQPATETPGTYPMSKEGRRQAIILLLGVASIGVFPLWSLITILDGGITGVEWVSSLLMLGILIVAPLVAWTLLEEANARIVTDEKGITYSTLGGISLKYGWADIAGFKDTGRKGRLARFFLGDDDSENDKWNKIEESARAVKAGDDGEIPTEDEPDTMLLTLRKETATQIANPMVRFLHKQAHGDALPIYGGLENRKALLGEISSRINA